MNKPMALMIEVPIEVDEKLTDQEQAKLRRHLRIGIPVMLEQLQRGVFDPGPRMLSTVCRFHFGRPVLKVEYREGDEG